MALRVPAGICLKCCDKSGDWHECLGAYGVERATEFATRADDAVVIRKALPIGIGIDAQHPRDAPTVAAAMDAQRLGGMDADGILMNEPPQQIFRRKISIQQLDVLDGLQEHGEALPIDLVPLLFWHV